jgi:hypothetical protein
MAEKSGTNETKETDHLDDLPDGSGCTEIWEHLSEDRVDTDG